MAMEIELRHLRLVRAIGDHGSVTRAAVAVGQTQPAVSRQLRRIEEALGGPLFERRRDGVDATALGKLVLTRARAVLPAVDSLASDAEQVVSAHTAPAELHLGARVGPAMMGLVSAVRALAPDARIVAESETRIESLLEMVGSATVDAAVINEFVGHEISVHHPVRRTAIAVEPVFVMLADDHPLAAREEVHLAELADQEWVLDPLDLDREYDVVAGACDRAGFTPRVQHYLHGSPAADFVRSRGFVGLCYPVARFSGIVTRPLAGTPLYVRHVLVTHTRSFLDPRARTLARHVVDELDTAAAQIPSYAAWLERHGTLPTAG